MTDIERDMTPPSHGPGSPAERPGVTDYLLAMGHELRAPLNGVIGMSGLLLDGDLTAQQRQYVKSVHSAGESLGAILNDILDLARVTTSRLIVEPIPFDLKSMIEETASVLAPRAAERGLALRVNLRPELPRYVIGDPGRTRQVLGNLVGHAVNGTSQGEIVIRVQGDGDHGEHAWVRFVVEDTGIGISAERLQRVFDDYVQVDASPYRSFGVTGLGLRLSAELVRLMGGDIGAESTPGKGSRFWFTLPLVVAEPASTDAPAPTTGTSSGRALIVDPDAGSRSRFIEQFDAAGWDVAFVEDVDRVVNELREGAAIGNPYSICVFSHYAVRPIHVEIATRLKADQGLAKIALVMITAVGSPGEGKKLWHAGFAAYLRRPVAGEEVHETLQALDQAGPDGRPGSLVTRHSLAEARNAQSFEVDGIDRMLASLGTAEGTRRTLLIPVSEMAGVSELFDQRGLAADTASSLGHALSLLGDCRYECVVFDVRGRADLLGDLTAIRERLGAGGAIPVVAVADATTDPDALIGIGLDEIWTAPVGAEQLDRALARWQRGEVDAPIALAPAPQWYTAVPLFAAPKAVPLPVVEPPPPASDMPFASSVEEAPSDVEGLTDAQWELHTPVAVVDGFVATEQDHPPPAADAIVEAVELAPPSVDVIPTEESAVESIIEPVELDSPIPIAHVEVGIEATTLGIGFAPPVEGEPGLGLVGNEHPDETGAPELEAMAAASTIELDQALDIISPALLEQAHTGGGFFTQYQVASFLREVPSGIADIATAATRGDAARVTERLSSLQRLAQAVGAARIGAVADRMEAEVAADRLEAATAMLGGFERAFQEAREALKQASPQGLPADAPAVGNSFAEQLSPAKEGAGRTLAQKLAASFVADAPRRLADLRAAVTDADGDAVQRVAQTFKGMCGLIGAEWLAKLVALAEADARLKRVTQAERYLEPITLELSRVLAALERIQA